MSEDLNDLAVFAKVAELGGISAAARALRMQKSTVSRRVASLETGLGVRLLERSTRAVRLTEVGEIYFRHCARIVEEAQSARESVTRMLETPRGTLRISASIAIGQYLLAPHLAGFMARYPDIQLDVQLDNRRVDLIREGYDVVVRVGQLNDSSLISRPFGEDYAILVAARSYLERHGTPEAPDDLKNHRILAMAGTPHFDTWELIGPDGRPVSVPLGAQAAVNDLTTIRRLTLDGCGVARLPRYLCSADLERAGGLVRVLPEWRSGRFSYCALYPSRGGATLKLKVFLDHFAEVLKVTQ